MKKLLMTLMIAGLMSLGAATVSAQTSTAPKSVIHVVTVSWKDGTTPEQIKAALEQGAKIHPQYMKEYKSGVGVSWHRVPWTLGCSGRWTEDNRAKNYANLCAIDGRIVLAGEHASYIGCWMEGALLSSLDAITRLHKRALEA